MRLKFSNNAKYFYLTEKPEKMPAYFFKSVAYNLPSNLITAKNLDLELGGGGWYPDLDLGILGFCAYVWKKPGLLRPCLRSAPL